MKLSRKGVEKVLESVFLTIDGREGYIERHWMPMEDLTPYDFEDFEKELSKFFFKLMEEQKSLPTDMARALNEHFLRVCTIKLSEMGLTKLSNEDPQSVEFKPNDFTGAVILTIDEAKKFLQTSDEVLYWSDCGSTLTDQAMDMQILLKQRIKEAEKGNG